MFSDETEEHVEETVVQRDKVVKMIS